MTYNGYYVSPIGNISIVTNDDYLLKLNFTDIIPENCDSRNIHPIIKETVNQLKIYFSGHLPKFDLPIHLTGSEFQKAVLDEVQNIPIGTTVTYSQLAQRMGSTRLTRAVAAVNASNNILIAIPCHRVVGKDNSMTGYAGEIWRKEWLLRHENALLPSLFN